MLKRTPRSAMARNCVCRRDFVRSQRFYCPAIRTGDIRGLRPGGFSRCTIWYSDRWRLRQVIDPRNGARFAAVGEAWGQLARFCLRPCLYGDGAVGIAGGDESAVSALAYFIGDNRCIWRSGARAVFHGYPAWAGAPDARCVVADDDPSADCDLYGLGPVVGSQCAVGGAGGTVYGYAHSFAGAHA